MSSVFLSLITGIYRKPVYKGCNKNNSVVECNGKRTEYDGGNENERKKIYQQRFAKRATENDKIVLRKGNPF